MVGAELGSQRGPSAHSHLRNSQVEVPGVECRPPGRASVREPDLEAGMRVGGPGHDRDGRVVRNVPGKSPGIGQVAFGQLDGRVEVCERSREVQLGRIAVDQGPRCTEKGPSHARLERLEVRRLHTKHEPVAFGRRLPRDLGHQIERARHTVTARRDRQLRRGHMHPSVPRHHAALRVHDRAEIDRALDRHSIRERKAQRGGVRKGSVHLAGEREGMGEVGPGAMKVEACQRGVEPAPIEALRRSAVRSWSRLRAWRPLGSARSRCFAWARSGNRRRCARSPRSAPDRPRFHACPRRRCR